MWVHRQNAVTREDVLSVTADDVGQGRWASRRRGRGERALVILAVASQVGTWGQLSLTCRSWGHEFLQKRDYSEASPAFAADSRAFLSSFHGSSPRCPFWARMVSSSKGKMEYLHPEKCPPQPVPLLPMPDPYTLCGQLSMGLSEEANLGLPAEGRLTHTVLQPMALFPLLENSRWLARPACSDHSPCCKREEGAPRCGAFKLGRDVEAQSGM